MVTLNTNQKLSIVREMIRARNADACVHGEILLAGSAPPYEYEDKLRAMTTAGLRRERLRLMDLVLKETQPGVPDTEPGEFG